MPATALKTKPKKEKSELLSIAKIAFRCGLDRATARKRLDALGYEPESESAKLKLYLFDAGMEAELTESNDKLADVRIRKETADAQLKETKLAQLSGELVPIADAIDMVQAIFGAMYKEIAVRQPKRIAARLARSKTASEASNVIKHDTDRVFKTLRGDFEQFLK